MVDGRRVAGRNRIRDIYENIRWCWVAFALLSVILQATRTVDMSDMHEEILDKGELALTITFDIEIVIRIPSVMKTKTKVGTLRKRAANVLQSAAKHVKRPGMHVHFFCVFVD